MKIINVDTESINNHIKTFNDIMKQDYYFEFSNSLDYKLLKLLKNKMDKNLKKLSEVFKKEFSLLDSLLKNEIAYKKYKNNTFKNLFDSSIFLSKILLNKKEISYMEKNNSNKKNYIILSLLLNKFSIHNIIYQLSFYVHNLDKKTDETKISYLEKNKQEIKKYYGLYMWKTILSLSQMLNDTSAIYFNLKSEYLKLQGLEPNFESMTRSKIDIDSEFRKLIDRILDNDYSAIYYIRTVLDLILQNKIQYLKDNEIRKQQKKATPTIIIKAIKNMGIKIDIDVDTISRIYAYCSQSLHQGQIIDMSKVLYMYHYINSVDKELKKVKFTDEQKNNIIKEIKNLIMNKNRKSNK